MADSNSITIQLPGGSILAACDDDILRARGVRYASASRFQQPVPLEKWDGVIDCTKPAPIPPQVVPTRLDNATGPINATRHQDEDCLYVTVTAPLKAVKNASKLPVMIYLHGGAYVSGGADLDCYEPSGLVSRDIVGVNVSNRLGVFGYLPIPGFAPANLGLLDQIAALRWVQQNIAAFGGDPENVTLFGQSAGADSIYCLLVSEGAEGLFHKAIMQSTPVGQRLLDRDPMITAMGQVASERLASKDGPQTTKEILGLQMQLMFTAKPYRTKMMGYGPSLGHFPLPSAAELPAKMKVAAGRIPILIGFTKHEGTPFLPMIDAIKPVLSVPLLGRFVKWFAAWFLAGTAFIWPSERFYKQYRKDGGQASLYRFKWSSSKCSLGSAHCTDLPFILGTWDSWKDAPVLGGPSSRDVVMSLGEKVKDVWAAFARGEKVNLGTFSIVGDENHGDIVFD